MVAIHSGGFNSPQYTYNGDSLRMSKAYGLTTLDDYTWDISGGGGLPLLLQDGSASFIYGPGGMLLEEIPNSQPTQPYYYHTDQLGSVRALTDSSGNVVSSYSYDAYGNPTTQTGSVYNPFGYTAEYTQ